jgi:hypothetical protein
MFVTALLVTGYLFDKDKMKNAIDVFYPNKYRYVNVFKVSMMQNIRKSLCSTTILSILLPWVIKIFSNISLSH